MALSWHEVRVDLGIQRVDGRFVIRATSEDDARAQIQARLDDEDDALDDAELEVDSLEGGTITSVRKL